MKQKKLSNSIPQDRMTNFDLLRIVSCIFIIVIHVSFYIWSNHFKYWNFLNTFARPMLWVFMMLSGFFLLEKPVRSITRFYITRISKVGISLIVYTIICQTCFDIQNITSISSFFNQISFTQMLTGQIPHGSPFWFIYSLIGLYILTPFLIELFHNMSNKRFTYFLCVVMFFMLTTPILSSFFSIPLRTTIFIGNEVFFFYIFGYAIHRLKLYRFSKVIYLSALFFYPLSFIIRADKSITMDFDGASITMVALCSFVFVIFYNMKFLNKSNGWIAKAVSYFGKSTFGIYMIHMFVIERMLSIPFFNISDGNYRYQVIFNVIVVFFVSFAISQVVEFLIVNPLNRFVKFLIKLYDDKKVERTENQTIKPAVE